MLLPGFSCCLGLVAHLLLTKREATALTLNILLAGVEIVIFYYYFIMFMNPKTYTTVRFNSYITEYQTELLSRLSRERNCSKTELLREGS